MSLLHHHLHISPSLPRYTLHPLVVFSILDHYRRRAPGQRRVVGTLMGERSPNGDEIVIKSAFPVPHQEDEDQVAVDMDYHHSMLALHKSANPREIVVGWYSTTAGNPLTYISSLMHEVYRQQVSSQFEPLLLTVDVAVKSLQLGVRGFIEKLVKVNGQSVLAKFEAIEVAYTAYDEEKIGVEALIRGAPDESARLDAPANLLPDVENLEAAMVKLLDALDVCSNYVDSVLGGSVKGDVELAHAIQTALNSIPHLDQSTFSSVLTTHIQDLLMIVYLAKLTKTQIHIADKVNGLLQ